MCIRDRVRRPGHRARRRGPALSGGAADAEQPQALRRSLCEIRKRGAQRLSLIHIFARHREGVCVRRRGAHPRRGVRRRIPFRAAGDPLSRGALHTEPTAGGSVTSFRFHLSDGTSYEVIYSEVAVKSGRIITTDMEQDFFTSADIGATWESYDYEATTASEDELPALYE